MERLLAAARGRLRRWFVEPPLRLLFERFDQVNGRLDHLEHRLDEIEGLLEHVSARASARSEASSAVTESAARSARRLDEIERALGAR
jgi:tetrahydromethanopterin S-methyltransferase subunit G